MKQDANHGLWCSNNITLLPPLLLREDSGYLQDHKRLVVRKMETQVVLSISKNQQSSLSSGDYNLKCEVSRTDVFFLFENLMKKYKKSC